MLVAKGLLLDGGIPSVLRKKSLLVHCECMCGWVFVGWLVDYKMRSEEGRKWRDGTIVKKRIRTGKPRRCYQPVKHNREARKRPWATLVASNPEEGKPPRDR